MVSESPDRYGSISLDNLREKYNLRQGPSPLVKYLSGTVQIALHNWLRYAMR